jgi:hypothetical protein
MLMGIIASARRIRNTPECLRATLISWDTGVREIVAWADTVRPLRNVIAG